MGQHQKGRFFGRNASVLLDVIRFAAAVAVALGHLPDKFLQRPPIIPVQSGNTAVCIFFVLSGFVIRYITVARTTTPQAYAADRISRIYSVVLPILALNLLIDLGSWACTPVVYHNIAESFPLSAIPRQLGWAVTFTLGWWNLGQVPLSNGPFWSLPFDCMYCILYGLMFFGKRSRWVFVPMLLLLVGPAIALLFPVWLLGVALHDVYVRLHARRDGIALATGALFAWAGMLYLLRRPMTSFLEATTITRRETMLTGAVNGTALGHALYHGTTVGWLNRWSPSYYISGTLFAFALLPLLLLLDRYLAPIPERITGRIRLIADSTFVLYLFHEPFFLLVGSLAGGRLHTWTGGFLALLAAVVLSIGLGKLCDRLKKTMRTGLRERTGALTPQPVGN